MSVMDPLLNDISGKKKKAENNNNNSSSSIDNNNNSSNDDGRACAGVMAIITLLMLIAFVTYLFLHDKEKAIPKLEFQINSVDMKLYYNNNVSIEYYSIIVGNTKQQQFMAGDLEFNLTLKNKDLAPMYFIPMELSLQYDELFLSSSTTTLEPFFLAEDQRRLQFEMKIKDDLQNRNVDSVSRVLSDQNNVVQFALEGNGHVVHWHRGVLYSCGINLLCDDIKVGILPANANNHTTTGSMIASPLLCKCNFDCHIV